MNKRIKLLVLFFILFLPHAAANFAEQMGVSNSTKHLVPIASLKQGGILTSFDPTTGTFPHVSIKATQTSTVEEIYHITTPQGHILTAGKQPFYDLVRKEFVPAAAWTATHVFVDQNLLPVQTTAVTRVQSKHICYELYLHDHHIFFASEARVMTHNNPLAIYCTLELGTLIIEALPSLITAASVAQHIWSIGQKNRVALTAAQVVTQVAQTVAPAAPSSATSLAVPTLGSKAAITATHAAPAAKMVTSVGKGIAASSQVTKATGAKASLAASPPTGGGGGLATSTGTGITETAITTGSRTAVLQIAIPVAMIGGAVTYGLYRQEVRRCEMSVLERKREIDLFDRYTIENHRQATIAAAHELGLTHYETYSFGRFGFYRFAQYLEFLKTYDTYGQTITALRDLLSKPIDLLSPVERCLLEYALQEELNPGVWKRFKQFFSPEKSCAQHLDSYYGKEEGYIFTYGGQEVTLSQLITCLAHEADYVELKTLEQQLAAFLNIQEATAPWRKLTALVTADQKALEEISAGSGECCVGNDSVQPPSTGDCLPVAKDTARCGLQETSTNEVKPCDHQETASPPLSQAAPTTPKKENTKDNWCGWSNTPQLPGFTGDEEGVADGTPTVSESGEKPDQENEESLPQSSTATTPSIQQPLEVLHPDFSQLNITHIVAGEGIERKGVIGAHNQEKFLETLRQTGAKPEDLIITTKESKQFPGIYEIGYVIPCKDKNGKFDLALGNRTIDTSKTVYNPIVYSDKEIVEWGKEAMREGINAGKIKGKQIFGESLNGMKFIGYIDEGKVTNFFPVLEDYKWP